jgi:transcriptional regulator with XRE-family HTH domain
MYTDPKKLRPLKGDTSTIYCGLARRVARDQNMSASEMAEKFCVDEKTAQRWMRGEVSPSAVNVSEMLKLCHDPGYPMVVEQARAEMRVRNNPGWEIALDHTMTIKAVSKGIMDKKECVTEKAADLISENRKKIIFPRLREVFHYLDPTAVIDLEIDGAPYIAQCTLVRPDGKSVWAMVEFIRSVGAVTAAG